jgi:hypothetical protein
MKGEKRMAVAVEVSAKSYREFILDTLGSCGGVMCTPQMEALIFKAFSPYFTEADERPVKGRNRLKWQNNVDWAKAVLCRNGEVRTIVEKRLKFLVLVDGPGSAKTPIDCLEAAKRLKPPRSAFYRLCVNPHCSVRLPLSYNVCPKCFTKLPVPNQRHEVNPVTKQ